MSGSITMDVKLIGLAPILLNHPHPDVFENRIKTKEMAPEEIIPYRLYPGSSIGDGLTYPTRSLMANLQNASVGQKMPGKRSMGLKRFIPLIRFKGEYLKIYNSAEELIRLDDIEIHQVPGVINGARVMITRPKINDWSLLFKLDLIVAMFELPEDAVIELVNSLFERGGLMYGLGDWRPETGGIFGTYAVERFEKI